MNYCSSCGSNVRLQIPPDDTRMRHVCEQCGEIHYRNPRNVVGTIPIWENQILLCRRAIAPRHGYWTLPAGFLEVGESTEHGAARETLEEAGAHVDIGPLFSLLNVAHVEQVHLFYLAHMRTPHFEAGTESLEVGLFTEAQIPWSELAFPTVKQTLQWYFEDLHAGGFHHVRTRSRDILPSERIE
ncbi:MAG: NUDIX hydrolase [Burkholderiaceae bacterium]|nr:NUDIX hydrolase [Burkholderiaceae bacterium]